MKNVTIKIDNPPDSPTENGEIRALVSAVLCTCIHKELRLPKKVVIVLTPQKIMNGGSENLAQISLLPERPDNHIILVSYYGATKSEVFYRIYHELCHLIRAINGTILEDNELEEIENIEFIERNHGMIEVIASAIIANEIGPIVLDAPVETKSDAEESQPNDGVSELVCADDIGERAGLQV